MTDNQIKILDTINKIFSPDDISVEIISDTIIRVMDCECFDTEFTLNEKGEVVDSGTGHVYT